MRRAVVLVSVLALVVGACAGGEDGEGAAADTSAASTTEAIVIRTRMMIAAASGAEPIATGEILDGSTLGGSPFCAGGTILDSHGSDDPTVEPYGLIDRTITCQDGTVRVGFTPDVVPLDQTQSGSWTIVSGTGAFGGLRGSGEMEIVPDPDDDSLGLETLTGTVTR